MGSHSLNSPSSMAKRRACSASAMMEKGEPNSSSIYAAEGTAAHELGEICLKLGDHPIEKMGMHLGEFKKKDGTIEKFIVDGDMVEAVDIYVDHCRGISGGEVSCVEERFMLPFIGKGEKGTSDFVSVHNNVLHVVDYKHGQGVPVEVVENDQGICYGLGAAEKYKHLQWEELCITIVQPRAWHRDGPIRSWSIPREDLLYREIDLAYVAAQTRSDDPTFNPSEYCRWCKGAYHCMGIVELIKKVTGMDLINPEKSDPVDIYKIPEDKLAGVLFDQLPIIEKWVHTLKDYAQHRGETRNPLPGTKLVETRATRKWKDPGAAEKKFGKLEGAYDTKFKSAPQMEKLIGKKKFAEYEGDYVVKNSSGVTLVKVDDPRPSARPGAASEFSNVELF